MTKRKYRQSHILIAVGIIAGSMSVTLAGLYYFSQSQVINSQTSTQPTEAKSQNAAAKVSTEHVYSPPSRLVIAKLGIDAAILPLGLTATDAMEAPDTNEDTGWFKDGARPGNKGSAVIDGHLGLRNDAVFGNLTQLVVGDQISVTDTQGSVATFVVRDIRTYSKDDPAADIFNSKDGSHLNLITCNGDWESSQATYSQRLVVFSDKIPQ